MSSAKLRCLHIAPQNISDVPMMLVRAERALGLESRLVTFFADPRGYPEDICLNLPFTHNQIVKFSKKLFSRPDRLRVTNRKAKHTHLPPRWETDSVMERALIAFREKLWLPKIKTMMKEIHFWDDDIYSFEAGLDFFRDGRTVKKLKALGKKIIVIYTGSDLRTRGIIPAVDALADVRITFEWDHLELHPKVTHLLFPFEPHRFSFQEREPSEWVRIGHAPTHREAKGSDKILAALARIAQKRKISVLLIENLPHHDAVQLKSKCDIFIDQIGELGYGINALEAIAMGIPTCSSLTPAFKIAHPRHPFVEIDEKNLEDKLLHLIDRPALRRSLARKGRKWVEENHDSRQIVQKIHRLLNRAREAVID